MVRLYVGQKRMFREARERDVTVLVNSKFRRIGLATSFRRHDAYELFAQNPPTITFITSCPLRPELDTEPSMSLSRSTARALWRCPVQKTRHQSFAVPQISLMPDTALRQHTRPSTGVNAVREEWRIYRSHKLFPPARRRFSASATAAHGHLTPPKPGEE